MAETESPLSSSLCVGCGLCCNGVLFTNARAEADEVEPMRTLGVDVEQIGERLQFRLPCPHLGEAGCTIYHARFTKCRTFRCALLKRLDAGETSLDGPLALVAKAKQMLSGLVEREGRAALAAHRADRRREGPPTGDEGVGARRLWLDMIAFEVFLDRTFRNTAAVREASPSKEASLR